MLPDGAHLRSEDWTIFYLNQTPRNAVAPVLISESPISSSSHALKNTTSDLPGSTGVRSSSREGHEGKEGELGELLFVLNCVRMKEDKSVRR